MSDHILALLPTDPTYVPTTERVAAVCALLARLLPKDEAEVELTNDVRFFCATELFERIYCPRCRQELELGWWDRAMNAAFSQRFRNLAITTPCCGATSTLNDLDYRAPQAFARFAISYLNPSRNLTIQEVEQVGEALGHPVRKVWAWI